ncbi:MAG: 4-phosphoerythronate dehydrogenase [Muribaculaceae bacterium]|nr:4-phosphoerythronate dehydrogenase [Muribaculaceae bacterium]
MKKPRIKIDENIPYIKGRLDHVAAVEYLAQDNFTNETIRDADALIIRTRTRCNRSLLENSSVRLIVTATIGTDHIDLDYCREAGITVANCPGCNAPGVAQYVWSSLLRTGFRPGIDKLGIIGCGNVGSIVAEWGLLLGTEILVNDPPKAKSGELRESRVFSGNSIATVEGNRAFSGNSIATVEGNRDEFPKRGHIREASLKEILRECKGVTIHTPLTHEGEFPTYHLLGENLKMLQPEAIIINAARGPVIDSSALIEILSEQKQSFGRKQLREDEEWRGLRAVIDTWEGEPEISRELLNLTEIATPHIAGYSKEGKERATRMSIEAVNEFFNISGDISGLTGAYKGFTSLTAEQITDSYNPYIDDEALKANPGEFEKLRHDYNYREEVR